MELDFATFASIYPLLCNIKVRNEDASLKCESELQTIFLKNLEDIECSYIRVNYEPQFMPEENSENEPCDDMDLKFITEYEQRIKDCICQKAIDDISLGNYLREQKTLLRELLYTYNDLWFRQSSWWKGLVFYSQLESILLGVAQYEKLINELDVQTNRAALTKQTCKDLAKAISNVNNFNKLLQSVNQYVVNVPNYEMQTKVNVEKQKNLQKRYIIL